MKNLLLAFLVTQVLILTACQNATDVPTQTEAPQEQPTIPALPTATDVVELETSMPDVVEDEGDAPTATVEIVESPPEQEEEITSSLIAVDWDDRGIFLNGLVPGEEKILEELEGATVYQLEIDITDPTLVPGKMEARYTNQEDEPLIDLALHLFPGHLGGEIEISNVLIDGNPVASMTEDGMLRVPLEKVLAPGEQTVLALDFVTTVPGEESTKYKVLAYDEGILALAHFYPMFAVYDDQGWHREPSADHGDETFADMSFYLVQVNAPADYTLVASGIEAGSEINDAVQQKLFAAGPMRDFYLAASADYDVVQEQIGPVTINSYAPADRMDGAQMALDVTADAVQSYGSRFGDYPYSELDVVSTPTEALGIEYPGVFANALRIYDLAADPGDGLPNSVYLESTTAHETAHQWFYGLIGNDQLNEPWLDESLTQYATWLYYIDRYGEQNAQGYYGSFEGRWARAENPDMPIGLPASAYSGQDYGAIVYGRGPILLHELAVKMGQETFDNFLLDYSEQYFWEIASGEDFMKLAEQHCDCDLSDLFAEHIF